MLIIVVVTVCLQWGRNWIYRHVYRVVEGTC